MKKLILLVISCMFLFSCDDREVELDSNFGFIIESEFSENIDVKTNSKLELEIIPSKVVEDTEYFISYKVLKGNPVLKNKSMELLPENTFSGIESLDSLKTNYYIFSDQIGESSILINYSDNLGAVQLDTLVFNVNEPSFELELLALDINSTPIEFDLDDDLILNLKLTPVGNNEDITYEYTINNDIQGSISHLGTYDTSNLTEEVYSGTPYPLDPVVGDDLNTFIFSPSDYGSGTFEIEVTASNGVTKTAFVDYNVNSIPFITDVRTRRKNTLISERYDKVNDLNYESYTIEYQLKVSYNSSEHPDINTMHIFWENHDTYVVDLQVDDDFDVFVFIEGTELEILKDSEESLDVFNHENEPFELVLTTDNGVGSNTYEHLGFTAFAGDIKTGLNVLTDLIEEE